MKLPFRPLFAVRMLVERVSRPKGVTAIPGTPTRLTWRLAMLSGCFVITSALPAADRAITVSSLEELRQHVAQDGVKIRMQPGTYRLDTASAPNFLEFSGSDAHYDFNGVKLEVDTEVLTRFKEGLNMLYLSGDRVLLEGLELETTGTNYAPGGCRAISIIGDSVTLSNVSLRIEGSYPYGYGSFFGIGSGSLIHPRKMNGIRVGGLNNQIIDCRVITRGFGHAIFMRGAQNALIKGCYVEGALRKTDDILAENSGPAFDLGFIQTTGEPVPPGQMTSLSEDGIRCYPDDPFNGNRRTRDIRVEDCRVVRMRKGVAICRAAGTNVVENCDAIEIERVAFHIGSNTRVRNCRADALYAQRGVLDIYPQYANADVEIDVLDSRGHYGNEFLAKISGTQHRVVLREAVPGAVPTEGLTVELGAHAEGDSRARAVELHNLTPAPVLLQAGAESCVVKSIGPVTDEGEKNTVKTVNKAGPSASVTP